MGAKAIPRKRPVISTVPLGFIPVEPVFKSVVTRYTRTRPNGDCGFCSRSLRSAECLHPATDSPRLWRDYPFLFFPSTRVVVPPDSLCHFVSVSVKDIRVLYEWFTRYNPSVVNPFLSR